MTVGTQMAADTQAQVAPCDDHSHGKVDQEGDADRTGIERRQLADEADRDHVSGDEHGSEHTQDRRPRGRGQPGPA